jgi:hypothetical protein
MHKSTEPNAIGVQILMSMAQPDYTSNGKTKAQRITEQFRDILELSIKEENR